MISFSTAINFKFHAKQQNEFNELIQSSIIRETEKSDEKYQKHDNKNRDLVVFFIALNDSLVFPYILF